MPSHSPPLIVAGFHRSGTSLTARSLCQAGLRLGEGLVGAGPSNPDGHFEHEGIVRFHDRLLTARGGSWDCPPRECSDFSAKEKHEARALAETLANSGTGPWGFKDPRACLFMPLWNEILDNPLKLMVYRDPVACMNSLLRREAQGLAHQTHVGINRIAMWREPDRAITLWCDYNEALLSEYQRAPEQAMLLSYTALVSGTSPAAQVNRHTNIGLDAGVSPDVHGSPTTVTRSIVAGKCLSTTVSARAAGLLDALNECFDGPPETLGEFCSTDVETTLAEAHNAMVAALDALGVASHCATDSAEYEKLLSLPKSEVSSINTSDALDEKRTRARELDAQSHADPDYAGLASVAGGAWLAAGDREAARRCFTRALRAGAPDHTADLHLGLLARDDGNEDTALKHFKAALKRVPTHGGLHAHIAQVLIRKGHVKEGVELARRGLEHEPAQSQLLAIVFDAAIATNELSTVSEIVQRAQAYAPLDWRLAQWQYRIALATAKGNGRQTQALRLRALALRLPGIDNVAKHMHDAVDTIDEPQCQVAFMQAIVVELESLRLSLHKSAMPTDIVASESRCASQKNGAELRLAMSILVRDEHDVIESNIRYHASVGVERFVVTDNASIDGTRECLQALSREFDIEIIDEPSRTIDQDLWVTRMAECIRYHGDIDWLINNDADEFWRPASGDLRTAISQDINAHGDSERIGVLQVSRSNFVASREVADQQNSCFDAMTHRVLKTLSLQSDNQRWQDTDSHILLRTLPGKVITRLQGLESIDMGNHGAVHALDLVRASSIHIHHYPVRSFKQFESKVRNYGESLEKNTRFGPRVSRHLRYWYERYLAGDLQEEYLQMHPREAELQQLILDGYVVIDERLNEELKVDIKRSA